MKSKSDLFRAPVWAALAVLSIAPRSPAQTPAALDGIAQRLDQLEQENNKLRGEITALREQLSALRRPQAAPESPPQAGAVPSGATIEERLEIAERRIDEQAQTKVEASQRVPVRLSGMLLSNLYRNGSYSGGNDIPLIASAAPGRRSTGLTFRQSILGLEYLGTQTVMGARVRGSLFADFFEGLVESSSGYSPLRIRTASFGLDWANTSFSFSVDKPLFSPRDPSSFSFFGIAPLTGAGNLWRWQPQVRAERRFNLTSADRLRAQGALFQTYEELSVPLGYSLSLARRRPSLQGRLEYSHAFDEERRIELATAFHTSQTHAGGVSIPSRLVSIDWFLNPWPKLEVSGMFFSGENIHHFGALRQGFTSYSSGRVIAVHSRGGWAQLAFPITPRVTLNVFGGVHDDRNRDLIDGIGVNRNGAANIQYRIAPNVILSLEAMQIRTDYLRNGLSRNNRYDLAVAYLF